MRGTHFAQLSGLPWRNCGAEAQAAADAEANPESSDLDEEGDQYHIGCCCCKKTFKANPNLCEAKVEKHIVTADPPNGKSTEGCRQYTAHEYYNLDRKRAKEQGCEPKVTFDDLCVEGRWEIYRSQPQNQLPIYKGYRATDKPGEHLRANNEELILVFGIADRAAIARKILHGFEYLTKEEKRANMPGKFNPGRGVDQSMSKQPSRMNEHLRELEEQKELGPAAEQWQFTRAIKKTYEVRLLIAHYAPLSAVLLCFVCFVLFVTCL